MVGLGMGIGRVQRMTSTAISPLSCFTIIDSSMASKFRAVRSLHTRITTLPSGMRVASEAIPGCETATVGMWIDAGSRWESESNNGAAHFLEHIFFKGTRKRTQTGLEREIENMGAHLNAYTSREQSAYYAKVFRKDVSKGVEILADMLQNARLDPGAIEREREVILREQEEVEKQMDEVVFDHLHAVAYQGTSLGRTILGSSKAIRTLQRADLEAFMLEHYRPNRMILVGAGGVDHEELVNLANSSFSSTGPEQPLIEPKDQVLGHLKKGNTSSVSWRSERANYTGSEMRMRNDSMDHAHLAIAVEGASWTSPDYFPLLVAQTIVGSWNRGLAGSANSGSRLAKVVAENGLATSFMSFNTAYSETGLFGIYLVSDHKYDLDDLVYEVQQEWVRICLNASDLEVDRAKTQLKAAISLSLDGTTAICEDIGRQMLAYGKRYSWKELHNLIDAVDTACVRRISSEYLYDRDPAVVAIGPIGSVPDYNRIRASTMWLRN